MPNRNSRLSNHGLLLCPPNPSGRSGWNIKEVIDNDSEVCLYLAEHQTAPLSVGSQDNIWLHVESYKNTFFFFLYYFTAVVRCYMVENGIHTVLLNVAQFLGLTAWCLITSLVAYKRFIKYSCSFTVLHKNKYTVQPETTILSEIP